MASASSSQPQLAAAPSDSCSVTLCSASSFSWQISSARRVASFRPLMNENTVIANPAR